MRSAYVVLALALGVFAQDTQGQQQQQQGQGQQQQQGQQQGGQQQQGQQQQQGGQSGTSSSSASSAGATPAASGNPNAPPAQISQDNPLGNVFKAEMPEQNKAGIKGYVSCTGNTNGTGVVWSVNIESLPKSGGPFAYHVHEKPLSADGDCKSAGAHLDPQGRGEDPPCDPSKGLKSCQVGDLAGKHGKMTGAPWEVFYLDLYTSTSPGTPGYVGGRSIVIHDKEKNRLTCANLTMVAFASSSDGSSCNGSQGSSGSQGGEQGSQGATGSKDAGSTPTSKQAAASGSGPPLASGAAAGPLAVPATAALGLSALVAALL